MWRFIKVSRSSSCSSLVTVVLVVRTKTYKIYKDKIFPIGQNLTTLTQMVQSARLYIDSKSITFLHAAVNMCFCLCSLKRTKSKLKRDKSISGGLISNGQLTLILLSHKNAVTSKLQPHIKRNPDNIVFKVAWLSLSFSNNAWPMRMPTTLLTTTPI